MQLNLLSIRSQMSETIKLPEFLRVQLSEHNLTLGLCVVTTEVFCEAYVCVPTRELLIDQTWLHRSLLRFFQSVGSQILLGKCGTMNSEFEDLLYVGNEGANRWTRIVLQVFDHYLLEENAHVRGKQDVQYCINLRNALIEMFITFYT